ncbi:MAG TPA: CocE/NonD family hydrolase [Gemmatimonadaceae bacterium]|nr:CocE/NonD family hydrolase [Gemmatimonadaceae bacterium]
MRPALHLALGCSFALGAALPAQQPVLLPRAIRECSIPADPSGAQVARQSLYVPAADSVRLAVDVHLPRGLGAGSRLPTIFSATRYWRSAEGAPIGSEARTWVSRGYAYVSMDVRGTGASFGQWHLPWSEREVQDIGHVARWIARQPWSNGRVGTIGTSYPGNTALLAAAFGGPAVRAVVPRFMDFDMYTDLLFPGGVVAESLIVVWGRLVRGMDLNQSPDGNGSAGVRPVDADVGEQLLDAAVQDHRVNPVGFDQVAERVTYKDESLAQFGGSPIDASGAFHYRSEIERSGVPIFGWASWLDAGTAQGAINRFLTWRNPQLLVIGAWSHGGGHDANPFAPVNRTSNPPSRTQAQQASCFLHRVLGDSARPLRERAIIYYTMVQDRWKKTAVWPIPGTRQERFHLDSAGTLSRSAPARAGSDRYRVDFDVTTGVRNRWYTQMGGSDVVYEERSAIDRRLLSYTSAPLSRDIEVTGHPLVTLRVSSTHTDGNFIVYLEDVAPDGRVTYVTEGHLRALHRKLSNDPPPYRTPYPYRSFARKDAEPLVPGELATLTFPLLPTSVLFRRGHRIRISLAGADRDSFKRLPTAQQGDVTITVARGGDQPSYIELPVVPSR